MNSDGMQAIRLWLERIVVGTVAFLLGAFLMWWHIYDQDRVCRRQVTTLQAAVDVYSAMVNGCIEANNDYSERIRQMKRECARPPRHGNIVRQAGGNR